ncbi:MAG: Ig-like domain-containing protein [Acidimicrobiales bacterium]
MLDTADPIVEVRGLGLTPKGVDGACGWEVRNGVIKLRLNRERRIGLRAAAGNARPGADAGGDRRVEPGATITLDGSRSCDADGDPLSAKWELVSAPAGSAWSLTGATGWTPELLADRVGPYRIRLVVSDGRGGRSLVDEVVVTAGARASDGVDDDSTASSTATTPMPMAPLRPGPPRRRTRTRRRPGSPARCPAPGVLVNDADPAGGPLVAVLVNGPAHGSLRLDANGGFTYTPDADFTGVDRFSYVARNGRYDESWPTQVLLPVGPR